MATKSSFDIHSTYYESFLALSVSLRVNKHQLKMESHTNQAPVLRYRDITVTSESLRESLAAVCPVLGLHNVARVRRGTLALFEVDFTEQKALERFCKSMDGLLQSRLHDHLKPKLSPGQKLEVTVKLHLIMPNADKKDPQLREVTSDNCQECFSLLRESALFEFGAFNLSHPVPPDEESGKRELTIDDLREVLQELIEAAAYWFTVGVFLRVPYHILEAIKEDNHQCRECLREMLAAWLKGTEASPAAVVQALRASGMVVLARKIAVKYGVTAIVESITTEPGVEPSSIVSGSASELIAFFSKQTTMADQSSRAQPVQVVVLKTLADQRERLATREMKCSEISQQLDHLQKMEEEVDESLEETKSSLGSVKYQIERLKSQQESLIREREKKESQKRWLVKQKASKFGEELVAVKQLIEDTEKAVNELSEKIDDLEKKTGKLEEEAEQMKSELQKQETDKDQLQLKVEETQKEKKALENTLEDERRQFQNEIERMTDQLQLKMEEAQKEKEALENTLEKDRRHFQKETDKMTLELTLKEGKMEVMQSKVEVMQDELSHRRKEVEMALAARNTATLMGYNQQTGQQGDFPGPYVQFQQEHHPTPKPEPEPEPPAPQPNELSPPPPPVATCTSTTEDTQQLEDQPRSEQHSSVVQLDAEPQPPQEKHRWAPGTVCVGMYNFPGSVYHDLPFKKGDELEIIAPSRDPNWYKAKRSDGIVGMIPVNYVRKKVKPHTMPWFHGNIGRNDAEKLLHPLKNGLFLVKENRAYKGDYTLCVCYDGKVEYYHVQRDGRNWVTVDDEQYFENLVKLVEHYEKEADGLCYRLKHGVEKTGSHDFVVHVEEFKREGWAIPKADLNIKTYLESGEFAEVWQGEYRGNRVTIKRLKEINSAMATNQFLAEASIMTTLQHPNIVALIGVSLDASPIYLVTEFMGKGSLAQYLRSKGRAVSKTNLLAFSRHVCNGMVYLESRNFIHRDLAAHNVFISDDGTAKISNFFLAREGLTHRTDSQKLPVKWTAPEALKDNKFSNKSDVWSFGILLWELYSYGRIPYPGIPANDIAQFVGKGYRMKSPDGCPDSVYAIMMKCWEADPAKRPDFTHIMKSLDSVTDD